jgi:hypothetical protein
MRCSFCWRRLVNACRRDFTSLGAQQLATRTNGAVVARSAHPEVVLGGEGLVGIHLEPEVAQ